MPTEFDSDDNGRGSSFLLPAQPPEEPPAQPKKENVREPDEDLGVEFGVRPQSVGHDDEEKIKNADDQTGAEAE